MQTPLSTTKYHFETVKKSDPYFEVITDQFNTVIAPIYGEQTEALAKIASGNDRICEVLIEKISNIVVGILVYKSEPVNEFKSYNIHQALELKTLFVVNASSQSGKGIGSLLIDRITKVASDAAFNSVVVTVSNEKPESQSFFLKKNFVAIAHFEGKYKKEAVETLYALKI